MVVHAGAEPELFTCHFLGWEPRSFTDRCNDPYEVKLSALLKGKASKEEKASADPRVAAPHVAAAPSGSSSPRRVYAEPTDYKLNYALLRVPSSELLPQIDPARREAYLADDDFAKILGTPRAAFEALPAWKRKSIKQGVGLF